MFIVQVQERDYLVSIPRLKWECGAKFNSDSNSDYNFINMNDYNHYSIN